MMSRRIKRVAMENLPMSQERVDLDTLASNVMLDVRSIDPEVTLFDVFNAIKELNETQDLFIFQNGTVSATSHGIDAWG